MNYEEALEYMYAQLPMFHRIGPAAYKPGLDTTLALLDLVGNPHKDLPCVHVAGTNGKGSTSHLIASVLQEAGYNVGLYTSPHLKDFRERIRINGSMMPQEAITDFVNLFRTVWEPYSPSFFEITVALAFWYFKKQKTDINVIEVGLGGRLDSTNVILPEVSVITNISYDHMNLLGDTIEKIALEKAGIIKPDTPVVIGAMRDDAADVIRAYAQHADAAVHDSSGLDEKQIPKAGLLGNYQRENRKTAWLALDVLRNRDNWKVSDESIAAGFTNVTSNTGLAGRWQKLGEHPLIIADVAHNEDGIRSVLQQVNETPHNKLHFVLGVVGDKDVNRVLALLPRDAVYYFCKADIPRGMPARELAQSAASFGLEGTVYPSVADAFDAAKKEASEKDLVFVGGSVFIVGEIL